MYNIIEVANTHGGDIEYVFSLIKEFEIFNKKDRFGMKFQPFKHDEIATKEYSMYEVYKKLFFEQNDWKKILESAYKTKDIWIDIFDPYSLAILKENISLVSGVKLQTSILENYHILQEIKSIQCNNLQLILNIAGRDINEIKNYLTKFDELGFRDILLEVGFQAYPTSLEDSGLNKIEIIKKHFPSKVVFADHIDGKNIDSLILPSMAILKGADVIEKHVMCKDIHTEYDYFSSLTIDRYSKMVNMQKRYELLTEQPFINEREIDYLEKTKQIPLMKIEKEAGDLLCLNDFIFKRSNLKGLTTDNLKNNLKNFYIASSSLLEAQPIHNHNLKKANIAVIIACRMKSKRLPKKAILKIGDLSSVETCIKNCLKVKNVNHVILATSHLEEDSVLKDYTFSESVIFHKGHPEDVIQRYLDIIDVLKIDLIFRQTADCPYPSADIANFLLKEHFASGADYTTARESAVGSSFEIINTKSLKKVKSFFPSANYSEYMTWYFKNNPEYFKLNIVDLPEKWIRDYRLTLDYPEDLEFFKHIDKYLQKNKIEYNIDSLFRFLDNNPQIASVNKHLTLKYETDQKLIDILNKVTKINV